MDRITDPTAYADQAEAAERELARVLDNAAAKMGMVITQDRPGPWLTQRIEAFVDRALSGQTRGCKHLLRGGPAPAFAALSNPGLIVCGKCLRQLIEPGAQMACDRCERPADELHLSHMAIGTIAVMVLMCDPCAIRDGRHPDTTD